MTSREGSRRYYRIKYKHGIKQFLKEHEAEFKDLFARSKDWEIVNMILLLFNDHCRLNRHMQTIEVTEDTRFDNS